MKKPNQKVILKAIQGDKNAIGILIERYYERILYTTVRKFGLEHGEDVAHKVIIEIIQSIKNLKNPEKFEIWMMRLIGFVCINEVKLKYRDKEVFMHFKEGNPDDYIESDNREFLPEEYVVNEEKRERVLQLIEGLPQKYQEALTNYYFHGMSYDEIAELMNTTNVNITNYLHRAKALLKKQIEAAEGKQFAYSVTVGGLPILTQLFRADAAAKLTPDVCASFLAKAKGVLLKANLSMGSTVASSGVIKAVMTGILSIGVVGSILAVNSINKPAQTYHVPLTTISSTANRSISTESLPVVIRTLEDMIGEDEANILRGFEHKVENKEQWLEFLEHIGIEIKSVSNEPDYQYQIFLLRKQDKQLMIAERDNKSTGQLDILYQFGNITELPLTIEIVLMFDSV